MASGQGIEDVGGPIRRLFGDGSVSGMDEGELLRRFANRRDPVALEALVARHGPMVLGVCRRVLGNWHASEDAFQATFLVLARRAGTIRDPDQLGPWLHGVAHRVAVRARADLARRNARERPGSEEVAMEPASTGGPDNDRAELRAALDEEVRRLPEKFRDPIILCYLDGLTHDEAASRLRCPVGTVRSRLSTGRARLRDRLARRGVAVPSGVFAAVLTAEAASAAVSPVLLVSTVRAATAFAGGMAGATAAGVVSAGVASLAEGVTTTMILSKLKIVGGLALAGMLTLGVGAVAAHQFGGSGASSKVEKPADETLDSLIAKLKKQAEQSEARTKQLESELKSVRQELESAQARPQGRDAKKGIGRQGGEGMGMGMGASGPGGMGMGMGMGASGPGGPGMMGRMPGMMGGGGGMGGTPGMMAGSSDPANVLYRTSGGMGGTPGMMAGMMGGSPPPQTLATLQTNDFVIVHKPKSDKVAAYSAETGEWASYDVPKGTDVVPIAGPDVVALMGTGEEIGQIATYVPATGKWYPIGLKEPVAGKTIPIVGPHLAAYSIGRHVYAFSAPSQAWDVLELEEGAKPFPAVFPTRVTVEHGDHLYIFSMKTGKWTDFNAKASRVETPGTK